MESLLSLLFALLAILMPQSPAVTLINDTRADMGIPLLRHSDSLDQSAAAKCNHMVSNNYWDHSGAGKKWSEFVWQYNPELHHTSEILSKGYNDNPQQRHQAWLNSQPHKESIVGDYKFIGSAICRYEDKSELTVVNFGREN